VKFLVLFLLLFNISNSEELSGGAEGDSLSASSVQAEPGVCSSTDIQENRAIIATCSRNWENWGIEPPPASELRTPNDCSGIVSSETALACGDAILALPIFFAEMAAMGIAATIPVDRNTLAYVSQNGSLQEIQTYLAGDMVRDVCGIAPWEVNTYPEIMCPTRNSHFDEEAHRACRGQAVERVQEYNTCRRSRESREVFRSRRSQLDARARQIKAEQDRRRALEESREADLSRIKRTCRGAMSGLNGTTALLLATPIWLASQAQTRVAPTQAQVQAYTNCVERETEGNQELREELAHAADGVMSQISRSFSSMKCYNGRVRKQLMCEVAMGILTGGAGLTAFALRRLGRKGAQDLAEELGRESSEEVIEEAVEEVVEDASSRAFPVGRASRETLEHIDEHVLGNQGREAVDQALADAGALLNGELADASNTSIRKTLKSFFNSRPPFRSGKVTTMFPDNVTPESILDDINVNQLSRAPSDSDSGILYQFDYQDARYNLAICNQPTCTSGNRVVGQDEIMSFYPECGNGVRKLVRPTDVATNFFRSGAAQLALEHVLIDFPCP